MAYIPSSGSVVTFQSDDTKLTAAVSVTATVPQSVSGVGQFNVNHNGNGSIITVSQGSVAVVLISGSVAVATGNSSVMLTQGTNTIGSVATLQGTNPWMVQLTSGSVITSGGNSSVQVNNIVTGQSSVYLIPGVGVLGSVATLQGTNPWVIGNSSVQVVGLMPAQSVSGVGLFNVNHTGNGSVIATNQITRNDTIASFLGLDLTARYMMGDSAGRVVTKPFAPNEAYVTGISSTVNTGPSSLLAGAGTGLRNYITDIWIANTGSVSTLVSFRDGDASVIGKTIAPAGGGSNIRMQIPIRTGGFNQPIEFTAGTATSILHVTALGYKAQ